MHHGKPEVAHQRFVKAFNAGDLDALVALYAADARFVPQPGQIVVGHAAIREALQGFLALNGTLELETIYAAQAGDIALLRGQWRLAGRAPDCEPLTLGGMSIEVVQRQPNGEWLYLIDHPNGAG